MQLLSLFTLNVRVGARAVGGAATQAAGGAGTRPAGEAGPQTAGGGGRVLQLQE